MSEFQSLAGEDTEKHRYRRCQNMHGSMYVHICMGLCFGVVKKVVVEDGQPVEYGQTLVILE